LILIITRNLRVVKLLKSLHIISVFWHLSPDEPIKPSLIVSPSASYKASC